MQTDQDILGSLLEDRLHKQNAAEYRGKLTLTLMSVLLLVMTALRPMAHVLWPESYTFGWGGAYLLLLLFNGGIAIAQIILITRRNQSEQPKAYHYIFVLFAAIGTFLVYLAAK